MLPRIFLSGRFDVGTKVETAWLKRTGCKYRCFTYNNIYEKSKHRNKRVIASLDVCEKKKIGIMMDSGAASIHNMQAATSKRGRLAEAQQAIDYHTLAEEMFQSYVTYCQTNKDKWTFYVTLDYQKSCPVIYKMMQRFVKNNLLPTPVYHGDASLDWLNRYSDLGCKLVGLGTTRSARSRSNQKQYKYYLDKVFDRATKLDLNLHGLAITGLNLMTAYPWWSVDSATWTKTASYGSLNFPDFDKNVIYNLHVSSKHSKGDHSWNKMSRRHQDQIKSTITELGFDFSLIQTSVTERHDFNGWVFSNLDKLGFEHKDGGHTWESI